MHIINNAKNNVCKWVFTAALGLASVSSQAEFSCELAVASQWGSGGTATLTITNTGDETTEWTSIIAEFPEGVSVPNAWGALASIVEPPNTVGFSPESWNASLVPSGSASVGFQYSVSNNADIDETLLSGDCATSSDNNPPVAAFTIGGFESIVNLDASTSTDPDGDALTYEWIINGESRGVISEPRYTSFFAKGAHVITLRVSDGELTSELSKDFNMPYPFDPYARFTIETDGLTVLVDGSGSTSYDPVDNDFNIISSYVWDFGDGTTGSGATASHTYDQAGTYTINLVVTDPRGDGSANHSVSVSDTSNSGFGATLSCENRHFNSYYANLDITINWDDVACSTSVQNTDSGIFTVSYDFGDGTGPSTPQTSNVVRGKNHRFANDGIYTVSASVDDGTNTATGTATVSAVGNGIKPGVAIACTTSGLTATCDYTIDDTEGDVIGRRIIWSSLTDEYSDITGSGTASHTFSEAGSYNIGLYAWDEHYVSVDNQWVEVTSESTNTPPEVNLECESFTLYADNFDLNILLTQQQTRCTANATDADGDTLTYAWNYGDGTTVTNSNDSVMYMYQSSGLMTISVSVSDGTDSTLGTIEYSVVSNGATPLAFLTCTTSELTVNCDTVGQTEDGIIPNMLIEWGDSTHEPVSPGIVSHTYTEAGNYTVVLHAYDSVWDDRAIQTIAVEGETQQAATSCEYRVVGDWGSQFQGNIVITNNSDETVSGWEVEWEYADGSTVTNLWNAELSGSNPYTATNLGWNASILPGESVTFGFNGENGGSTSSMPTLSGASCNGE